MNWVKQASFPVKVHSTEQRFHWSAVLGHPPLSDVASEEWAHKTMEMEILKQTFDGLRVWKWSL